MLILLSVACSGTGTDTGILAESLFDSLEACEVDEGDGELNFHLGCAGDACAGQDFAEWVEVLGDPECIGQSGGKLECDWGGRVAILDDENEDGLVDYWGEQIRYFYVRAPYAGSSAEGLGIGTIPTCFVDALGPPTSVELELIVGSTYYPTQMDWELPDLTVRDGDEGALDGLIDRLTVRAP